MALVGGVLAVWLGDGVLSLGSLVGFLTVFGIAARNGILMISHFQYLERYEGEAFGPALVLRGAKERLAPILMTASATGLALVPLAVAGSIPGHEIEHPMAIVILGGLVTSTLLNLFVLPVAVPALRAARDRATAGLRTPRAGCRPGGWRLGERCSEDALGDMTAGEPAPRHPSIESMAICRHFSCRRRDSNPRTRTIIPPRFGSAEPKRAGHRPTLPRIPDRRRAADVLHGTRSPTLPGLCG